MQPSSKLMSPPKIQGRILISGANRGIGLEFVREYAAAGHRIFACCRQPENCESLHTISKKHPSRLQIVKLDVTDDTSIQTCHEEIIATGEKISLLINNAGIMPGPEELGAINRPTLTKLFDINTIGPLLITQQFRSLLAKSGGAKVVNISSHLGSIKKRNYAGNCGYGASKAALNMITRTLAHDLVSDGIITISLDPGWVRTDLGGATAPLSTLQSVTAMRKFIDRLKTRHNGGFYALNGKRMPW